MENKQIIPYNELERFPETTDYYQLICNILNNILDMGAANFDNLYTSINDLRILNKFEQGAFSKIFDVVCSKINKLLLSENIDIAFLIFILLSEVLADSLRYNEINNWLSTLLPNILQVATEHQYLNTYAMSCLNFCATNGFYDDVITTLVKEIYNSESDIKAEYAYSILASIINNCDTMLLSQGLNWDIIIEALAEVYLNMRRAGYSFKICEAIKNRLNKKELFDILVLVEDDYTASLLNEMFKLSHGERVELNRHKNNN
jgi:hypothetical protein